MDLLEEPVSVYRVRFKYRSYLNAHALLRNQGWRGLLKLNTFSFAISKIFKRHPDGIGSVGPSSALGVTRA